MVPCCQKPEHSLHRPEWQSPRAWSSGSPSTWWWAPSPVRTPGSPLEHGHTERQSQMNPSGWDLWLGPSWWTWWFDLSATGGVRRPLVGLLPEILTCVLFPGASPSFFPWTSLTVSLFPKARLLCWNQEEEEAQEDRDCGIGAVAFSGKETDRAGGGSGSLRALCWLRPVCLNTVPLFRALFTGGVCLTSWGCCLVSSSGFNGQC